MMLRFARTPELTVRQDYAESEYDIFNPPTSSTYRGRPQQADDEYDPLTYGENT
mgnify:CR=1 FL=1|jgi:hypothetical protein